MKCAYFRLTSMLACIVICVLLGITLYLQTHEGITPCPLCILQRFTFGVVGVLFFFAATIPFQKIGRIIMIFFTLFFTGIGLALASRQVWLQYFPPSQNGDCGAGVEYMLRVLPIKQVIQNIFAGGTECSRVDWQFMSLSLAEWSLLCFTAFILLSCWQLYRCFAKTTSA